jgi:hypothetical protein
MQGYSPELELLLWHMRDYNGPVYVGSYVSGAADCVRLRDGRLHAFQAGVFPVLLAGPGYILAGRSLGRTLLALCGASIEAAPAQVINLNSGKTLARYVEIKPHDEIRPTTIRDVDASGFRAWHFRNEALFVTKPVMIALHKKRFQGLEFSPGFSRWC